MTFRDFVHVRDAGFAEALYDTRVPFGVGRPSARILTCKERARRLVQKFRPKTVKQVASNLQRPRRSPMTWGPVR